VFSCGEVNGSSLFKRDDFEDLLLFEVEEDGVSDASCVCENVSSIIEVKLDGSFFEFGFVDDFKEFECCFLFFDGKGAESCLSVMEDSVVFSCLGDVDDIHESDCVFVVFSYLVINKNPVVGKEIFDFLGRGRMIKEIFEHMMKGDTFLELVASWSWSCYPMVFFSVDEPGFWCCVSWKVASCHGCFLSRCLILFLSSRLSSVIMRLEGCK